MSSERPARGLFNIGVDPEEIWTLGKTIGKGAFGFVHVATSNHDAHKQAAVKLITVDDPEDVETIRKEVKILQSCNHANVVAFDNTYLNGETLWLVMEYCGGGSVADLLRFRALKQHEIHHVLSEILKGLHHLHQQHIIHRDLKSANLLLTTLGVVKVADFGVSKILLNDNLKTKTFVGTPHWMAPEIILGKEYDARCDMWSVGIVGIELAEQHPPKYQINMHGVLAAIPKAPSPTLARPSEWSALFVDFLAVLLVKEPKNRPTAETALCLPLFNAAESDAALDQVNGQSGQSSLICFIKRVCEAKKKGKLPPKPRRRAVRQGGFTYSSKTTLHTMDDETKDSVSNENDVLLGNWDTTTRTRGSGKSTTKTATRTQSSLSSSASFKFGVGHTQSSLLSRAGSTRTFQSLHSSHSSWSSLSDSRHRMMGGQQQQPPHETVSERTSLYSNMVDDPFAKGHELIRTIDHAAAALLRPLGIVQETAEEEEGEGGRGGRGGGEGGGGSGGPDWNTGNQRKGEGGGKECRVG